MPVPSSPDRAAIDLAFLASLGFVPGVVHDMMLLSQLLYGTRQPEGFHRPEQVAERELGGKLDTAEQSSDCLGELSGRQHYAVANAAVLPLLDRALSANAKLADLERAAEIEGRYLPAVEWLSPVRVCLSIVTGGKPWR